MGEAKSASKAIWIKKSTSALCNAKWSLVLDFTEVHVVSGRETTFNSSQSLTSLESVHRLLGKIVILDFVKSEKNFADALAKDLSKSMILESSREMRLSP